MECCEFLWSLGENVYAAIYGHIGTEDCAAFVWKLPIPQVYIILSMEECVRLAISFIVFKERKWMNRLA